MKLSQQNSKANVDRKLANVLLRCKKQILTMEKVYKRRSNGERQKLHLSNRRGERGMNEWKGFSDQHHTGLTGTTRALEHNRIFGHTNKVPWLWIGHLLGHRTPVCPFWVLDRVHSHWCKFILGIARQGRVLAPTVALLGKQRRWVVG